MHKIILIMITLACLAGSPLHAAKKGPAVHEYVLNNGMNIIVKQDHRAPVVISQVWYNVGAADEYSGITGISHVLEHMMFKGTKRYAAGKFDKIIAENGGQDNAFTGQDYTAYFQILEKSRLPIALELEADRMRNLLLPEEEFNKEIEVVKEERRMRTEDNPNALTQEQLYATAFTTSPYHHPIVGWMQDLDSMTAADLRAWYEQWYAPNNATLVVVGDVNPKDVYKLAKRYFGKHKAQDLADRKPRLEPKQRGERLVVVKAPAEVPYLAIGYKVPSLTTADEDWQPYALSVLAGILSGGQSSRLQQRLVRKRELVTRISADYNETTRYMDLFTIDATPAKGRSIEEVEQAIHDEIAELKKTLVSGDELKRIQAQVIASEVYRQDSISHQSFLIGSLETVGIGWEMLESYAESIQAVTAEQIREVANKYLIADGRTIAVLQPQPRQHEAENTTPSIGSNTTEDKG